jgi:predicted small metal-binding protein
MKKEIECPCGYVIRADDEEELVKRAQKHASESHGMELTSEQALEMARPV